MRFAAAAWLLLLSLLSVDQGLHRCLHEDADHAGHVCVLTLLAQGQMDMPVRVSVPIAPQEQVTVRDDLPLPTHARRFYRLEVSILP